MSRQPQEPSPPAVIDQQWTCQSCGGVFNVTGSQIDFNGQGTPTRCRACRVSEHQPHRVVVSQVIACRDCRCDFVFDIAAQAFFRSQGWVPPSRCPRCRKARRQQAAAQHQQG
jgi:hypothetical protein